MRQFEGDSETRWRTDERAAGRRQETFISFSQAIMKKKQKKTLKDRDFGVGVVLLGGYSL